MREEGIRGLQLKSGEIPERICVLRFHAFGDAVISLPLLAGLRKAYPNARIDFVTSEEYSSFFSSIPWIDHVHSVVTRSAHLKKVRSALSLRIPRPDVVVDIQNSRLSNLVRRRLQPDAWVAFDRYAPKLALERYIEALSYVGLKEVTPDIHFSLPDKLREEVLRKFSLPNDGRPLICLNPAGCWPTKNWPAERYAELGKRLVEEWSGRILLLGTENIVEGATLLRRHLQGDVFDLIGETTPIEAMILLRETCLMVSDDSGLMHLAWTNGVPTIGIFGGSRRTWSSPWGEHTRSFGSEDLSCGACMRPICAREDLLCLNRVSVDKIVNLCRELCEQPTRGTWGREYPSPIVGESTKE
ncbi:MAG: glycosyltransferase family 9 protein [Ignavibacteriae bacterium]|nr:glycosyltransferase family 9 protein [Ignavibacteriota bacterium]